MYKLNFKSSGGILKAIFKVSNFCNKEDLWERIISEKLLSNYMKNTEGLDYVGRRGLGQVYQDHNREVIVTGSLFSRKKCKVSVRVKRETPIEDMFNCNKFDFYLHLGN